MARSDEWPPGKPEHELLRIENCPCVLERIRCLAFREQLSLYSGP